MLEKIIQKNTEKSEISEQLKGLREQLTLLENKIKTAGVPVIITFDGWSAAGKGSMIAKLIRSLDPRFYKVVSYRAPNEQEKRMPWLWRYWQTLPKKGEFLILDRSWYRDTVNSFMYGEIDKETSQEISQEVGELIKIDIKNSVYSISNYMRQIQRLFDSNILRDWNEDIISIQKR